MLTYNAELGLDNYISSYINNGEICTDALIKIYNYSQPALDNNKTLLFYKFLINKLHKIFTELLDDSPKTVCQCIKTITSIITQATITLEKQFGHEDLESANEFIDCVGLKDLSNALYIYFSTGDISEVENQLERVRQDIIFVKDIFC